MENTVTKLSTEKSITTTAIGRLKPRPRKNSIAGFNPMAMKSETKIKTNTWLADASARVRVIAISAPSAARNPKSKGWVIINGAPN